jgi:short-subunit dehydrogenase
MNPQNKVVIITGASEGIGKALAEALSARGAKLVLAARSEGKLTALSKTLPGSVAVAADMHQEADIRRVVDTALEKFGRIDLLVNNAGRGLYGPLETVDLDAYREIVDLNVYAPLKAMQLVIPAMRKAGGGMILNISSMVSKNAYPALGAYASTKYALNALSFTARAELAQDHIAVSVFHPRMTATRFGQNSAGIPIDFSSRPGGVVPQVDTAEQVAEKIVELIASEADEANM